MRPTDSVWVFTNRARIGSEWQQARGPLSHLVRAFQVTPIRSDPVPYEVRLSVRATHERPLVQRTMLAALRSELARHSGAMVLHVHGYATSLDEAAEEAAEMRRRGAFTGPMAVFAWPAHAIGVTWPAPGKLFTNAYWQDASAAAESAADLAQLLLMLVDTMGAERIVVSAHSMGNQLLAKALDHPDVRTALSRTPLRAIVFASPDMDREQFRDEVVPATTPLAHRRVLYGARDDVMLRMSALLHNGRPRAGLLEHGFSWPATLDVVDITEGRVAAPWFGAWFDTNHALRRHGTALTDLFTIVAGSDDASGRVTASRRSPPM
jgi:esterase/lipase superfamily enzyme